MSLIEYGYKHFVRPRVFAASENDAEIAHEWGIDQLIKMQNSPVRLALARKFLTYDNPTALHSTVMGLPFRNPLGLAAGFDKYAEVFHTAIPACGWGFAEVGGFTPNPQEGFPRPRMLRSKLYQSLWNQMGFNNPGMGMGAHQLWARKPDAIAVGANIGKGKDTPLDRAHDDYCGVIEAIGANADFLVINVSSPNTKDLRQLQARDYLLALGDRVAGAVRKLQLYGEDTDVPWGFKISPDETDEQLSDMLDVSIRCGASFIIACNTTTKRDGLTGWDIPADRGGVSGRKLRDRSRQMLKEIYPRVRDKLAVISVGGIDSGDELYWRLTHGASLCQAYTAWPFEGPDFVKRCLKTLVARMKADGYQRVTQITGVEV